ncbi:sensor histidine kinase [Lacticaseibacillus absianus]|uniref:sensor histidine kinase n=1 Tax=Lacticaseibacillus absianus TaxID=2729623 RepID=UPI0031B5A388
MQSSFIRLIKVYTWILATSVIAVTSIFIVVNVRNYESELRQAENAAMSRITDTVSHNQQVVADFASKLMTTPEDLASLDKYFTTPLADYADYAIDRSLAVGGHYFFWPTESSQFFLQNPQITEMTLRMGDQSKVFVASSTKPGGELLSAGTVKKKLALSAPLINQYTLATAGVVSIGFNQQELRQQLTEIRATAPIQIAVVSDSGVRAFYYRGQGVTRDEEKRVKHALATGTLDKLTGYKVTSKALTSDYQLIQVTNAHTIQNLIMWRVLPLMLLGLALLTALSGVLWLIFRRYQHQLSMIVGTVQAVSEGDLNARVAIEPSPTDLKVLATGINAMLAEIHEHIYTIYQLRIAQQEANIKALQAQINPHFMSNTMEYIRMAALDADQPELAQVVYSFAALLRNNTDFSPMTTLKRELDFIDKYIFLYQVRFPDRLAYQISVSPEVAKLSLPKFSLQPIVENYFVHGVDFARKDNAMHLKAWREGDQVTITVVNNGRPLSVAEVAAVNQKMKAPLGLSQRDSIGLQNVYSRLSDYFGDSFDMNLSSDGVEGVQMTMRFIDKEESLNAQGDDR